MKRAITGLLLFLVLLAGSAVGQNYVNSYGFLVDPTGAVVVSASPQAGSYLNSKGLLVAPDGSLVVTGISGSSGTVTDVTTGNLIPLFTATTGASHTTTPVLAFTLSTAAAHTFLGNNTGSTAAPAYSSILFADIGNPAASKAWDQGAFTLNHNFSGNWGSGFGYSITSSGSNAATGPLFQVSTGASTSHDVFQACAQGTASCFKVNSSGFFLATPDNTLDIGASGATRPRTGYFGTSVSSPTVKADTFTLDVANADYSLVRSTSGNLQLRGPDTASPAGATVQGQGARAGTDSDVAGGDVTLRVGLGTGAGTPAQLHLQGSKTSPTATNLQVAIRRSSYNLSKQLTSGSATTVASIPLGVDTALAGFLKFSIEAIDTTNHKVCVLTGTVSLAAENSNGVFVASTPQVSTTLNPCTSASTLTATWAQTGADPSLLRVTPTTSITPSKFQIVYSAENFSAQAPTY